MQMQYVVTVNLSKSNVARHGIPSLEAMEKVGFSFHSGQLGQYARVVIGEGAEIDLYRWEKIVNWKGPIKVWAYVPGLGYGGHMLTVHKMLETLSGTERAA